MVGFTNSGSNVCRDDDSMITSVIDAIKKHIRELRPVDLDELSKVDLHAPAPDTPWDHLVIRNLIGIYARDMLSKNQCDHTLRYVDLEFVLKFATGDNSQLWFRSICGSYTMTMIKEHCNQWICNMIDEMGRESECLILSVGLIYRLDSARKKQHMRAVKLTYDTLYSTIDRFI